jgi:hypothetical protein
MNSSLINGLAMVASWIHCCVQISVPQITMYKVLYKAWRMNARCTQEMNYFGKLLMLQLSTWLRVPQWSKPGCASKVMMDTLKSYLKLCILCSVIALSPNKYAFTVINSFQSSYTLNTHSSETAENRTHVDVSFFTQNDLKLWCKLWATCICVFSYTTVLLFIFTQINLLSKHGNSS